MLAQNIETERQALLYKINKVFTKDNSGEIELYLLGFLKINDENILANYIKIGMK